ncbi:MAG: hypothetical protein RR183_07225 [Bacteroidales bacterium]
MKPMKKLIGMLMSLSMVALLFCVSCNNSGTKNSKNTADMTNVTQETIQKTIDELKAKNPSAQIASIMERGVRQVAALWREEDGSQEEFVTFCNENFMATDSTKSTLFTKLSTAYEQLFGHANQLSVALKKPVQEVGGEITQIDYIFGNYSPSAHFSDDMYSSKVAFITILNFPNYSLAEKNEQGEKWNRAQWAYSRMGDLFTSRVPSTINQEMSVVAGNAENYISSYNIMMGHLLNEKGERLFPKDMALLTHWNLRDEIKSNYANVPNAFEKQQMIYKVMEHIACQTIPQEVINNPKYDWNPYSNKVFENGKEIAVKPEGTTRYQHLLAQFKVEQKLDKFNPQLSTGILRNFEGGMEISADEIEALFVNLISSEQVKKVGKLIAQKLGRELKPYDIWFDGFKSRSAISEDELTAKTRAKYPNPAAFEKDMPNMLMALGFAKEECKNISSKIAVDGARGSGHAWGAACKWDKAHLRTRIDSKGMDYKGYNIAVHEFGHNVEQTLSLYNVDYYMLNGVPNTAYTEALAFVFQKRDLQLLGYSKGNNSGKMDPNTVLDIFWGCYEIMGVSLVDMYVWRWLYENPNATAQQLKDAVIAKAKEVWNKYYEPVLGTKDSPILAIYSHMINSPMYLPNYPFGHIIEFQLEDYFAGKMIKDGKDFASEIKRIYTQGTLTPQIWMQGAVGNNVSTDPMLKAVDAVLAQ